jgi:hypothetical protein
MLTIAFSCSAEYFQVSIVPTFFVGIQDVDMDFRMRHCFTPNTQRRNMMVH